MKNAKTSLWGLLTAVGYALSHSANAVIAQIAQVAVVVGSLMTGHSAADKPKS